MTEHALKKGQPYLGAHVSASGGAWKAIAHAQAIGADCIQIFGASPRMWGGKIPLEKDAARFIDARAEGLAGQVYLHAAYLANLASPEAELRAKSVDNLVLHLEIASMLKADGLIFHLGSGKGQPRAQAIELIAEGMKEVLARVDSPVPLVMENAAGGGDKVGARTLDFKNILELYDTPRMQVCFDTAHAFEAGVVEGYTPATVKALWDEWDEMVGLKRIVALHVNDSKTAFNSHHDRHENLGEGHIGIDGFRALAGDLRLNHAAWMLEVPGIDGEGPDLENMQRLRACFAGR